ncbi:TPA: ead/Ea22-like family protein [Escherichia coli]|nr:ead/Ea22-like family protein [Escherichia coli]
MSKIDYQALRESATKAKELGNISRYTKSTIARLEFKEAATPDAVLALLNELEAAEKRIAELEAREILLPERSSMLHRTDFHDDYQTVMASKVSEVIDAIRAAGIRIKGE